MVSWMRFSVCWEIQLLMETRACSGFSCSRGSRFSVTVNGGFPHGSLITTDPEVERQQFGSVHGLTDVLVCLVKHQRLFPKQPVGRDQLGGLSLLPVQSTVEFGEKEMDLIRCFLLDGVKLKHLWRETCSPTLGCFLQIDSVWALESRLTRLWSLHWSLVWLLWFSALLIKHLICLMQSVISSASC